MSEMNQDYAWGERIEREFRVTTETMRKIAEKSFKKFSYNGKKYMISEIAWKADTVEYQDAYGRIDSILFKDEGILTLCVREIYWGFETEDCFDIDNLLVECKMNLLDVSRPSNEA